MAASDAITFGHGVVSLVSRACGLSRKAIAKGIKEIRHGVVLPAGRMRRPGAGRKPITVSDPQLLNTLDAIIDEDTRGDPESPLRWTCKSTRTIAKELVRRHYCPVIAWANRCKLLTAIEIGANSRRDDIFPAPVFSAKIVAPNAARQNAACGLAAPSSLS